VSHFIWFSIVLASIINYNESLENRSPMDLDVGCSFKFIFKVGVEESIVNAPWITDHGSAV
jgi:hypothetical protein